MKAVLKTSTQAGKAMQDDGFKEVGSSKRHNWRESPRFEERDTASNKVEVPTRNFFAPLRTMNMDTDVLGTESSPADEQHQETQASRLK
jgi:hypothetical protein